MTQIAENGINLYSLPDCDEDEDEDYREQCRLLKVRRSTGNRHMSLIEFIDVIMVSSVKTGNKLLYLLQEAVPFAVIGANTVIEVKGKKVRGRMYPWGVVEVENPDHCDFIKLRTMLM